jgi:hypothetical protein
MGFDLDLFVKTDISTELQCSICRGILETPALIQKCQHIFCGDCIRTWRQKSNTCPMDRGNLGFSRLYPMPRPFLNMINELDRKCRFASDGCSVIFQQGNHLAHESVCLANPASMKPCEHNCGADVLPIQIPTHDCIEFLKSKLNFLVESNSKLEQGLDKLHVDLNEIEAKNRRLRNETETLETRLQEVHVESVKIQSNYENQRLQLLLNKSVTPVTKNAALENGNMDLVPTSSAGHAVLAVVAVPVSVDSQQPSPFKRARLDPPTPSAPKVRKYN